jgi:hypothetical protein
VDDSLRKWNFDIGLSQRLVDRGIESIDADSAPGWLIDPTLNPEDQR